MNHVRRPLVVALSTFLAGLLAALRFAPPTLLPLLATGLVLVWVAAGTAAAGTRKGSRRETRRFDRVFVLFGAVGCLVGTLARADAEADCRSGFDSDVRLSLHGRLAAASRTPAGSASRPLVPVLTDSIGGVPACAGAIRARLPPGSPDVPLGAEVRLSGVWRERPPVESDRWPASPAVAGFLVADTVVVRSPDGSTAPPLLRLRAAADRRLERHFGRHLPLVEALLLGRREHVDPDVRDRYARSGLSHLLAISGMHVGLLAGTLLVLASAFRASRRTAVHLTLGFTWVYLLVIGAPASAIRAGTMISLALVAVLLQRPAAATSIVSAAALAILAFRPLAILEPGFQLSFAGVLGILFVRPVMLTLTPESVRRRGVRRTIADSFLVGVAAFLVTAPIVAHHFGVIAPISILAGPPAVPLMSLALIGAAAALALDPLIPILPAILASASGLALDALDRLAAFAASVPFGGGPVPKPPWWTWSCAATIGFAATRIVHRPSRRLRWIAGTGSTLAVLVAWPVVVHDRAGDFEVHFIDVGQGDAIAIRTPPGRWVLVDTGPAADGSDAGRTRVLPFLRDRRVRDLEALVLTHPDLDHIGGAPSILAALPVDFVFEPGLAVGKTSYLDLIGAVEARGTVWRAARAGRSMELDGVRFDFLWPDPETVDGGAEANQISAVMRIAYGDFAILLTGDAGTDVENALVDRYGSALRAQVLKLGHHGSDTSTAERFLETVRPELAIVSAGRRNRYGHPSPSVVSRVERRGIPLARTDREGTIGLIVSDGGREWRRVE